MLGRPKAREKSLIIQTDVFMGLLSLGGPEPFRPLCLGQKIKAHWLINGWQRSRPCGLVVTCVLYVLDAGMHRALF